MPSPSDLSGLTIWTKGEVQSLVTGGAQATDGQTVATWKDQSGNSNDLTSGSCVYDATKGCVVSAMGGNQFFTAPAVAVNSHAFSLFFIVEISSLRAPVIATGALGSFRFWAEVASDVINEYSDITAGALSTYDGSFHVSSVIPFAPSRCLIGFVGDATAMRLYVNGTLTSVAALGASTHNFVTLLGAAATNTYPCQGAVKDLIYYNRALSDAEVQSTLVPYSWTRGVPRMYAGQCVFDGDSITQGYQSTVNRGWTQDLTLPANVRLRNFAQSSATLATLMSQAASVIDPVRIAGDINVLCIFAGTNDIFVNSVAQATVYANLVSYCQTRRAAGWNVVVFTCLPRGGTTATVYNADIRANWPTFADGMVDVVSDSRLSDSTNTTYFNADGIHLNNTGYAVLAGLAMPVLLPFFTASMQPAPGAFGPRLPGRAGSFFDMLVRGQARGWDRSQATAAAQTLAGSMTEGGALVRAGGKVLAGSETETGAIVKAARKALAGSATEGGAIVKAAAATRVDALTETGSVIKAASKPLAGATTETGGNIVRAAGKVLTGAATQAGGAIVRAAGKVLAGSLTAASAIVKAAGKVFAGSATESGTLTLRVMLARIFAGTLTAAATCTRAGAKTLAGSLSSTGGAIRNAVARVMTSTLTAAAVWVGTLQFRRTYNGATAAAGSQVRAVTKGIPGAMSEAGTLTRSVSKFVSGTTANVGALARACRRFFAGILTQIGILTKVTPPQKPEPIVSDSVTFRYVQDDAVNLVFTRAAAWAAGYTQDDGVDFRR